MRKLLCLVLCALALWSLVGCGDISHAEMQEPTDSSLYSEREIRAAMRATKRVFAHRFDGCILTELAYSEAHSSDNELTILAAFDVDSTGGPDGVLNPDSHYSNYKFTFVRALFGAWKLADNGYA